MKKVLAFAIALLVTSSSARADLLLGTSNPVGSPLSMLAGTTSGPMQVNVASDGLTADLMSAWQFSLIIVGDVGSAGTLTFNSPLTQTFIPHTGEPSNYVFASPASNAGIDVTNSSSSLSANDLLILPGDSVPVSTAGANLLAVDFFASSSASGLFGIFAQQGASYTVWTDEIPSTRFYSNVPDGTGTVRIGEVFVTASQAVVPEPGSLTLLLMGCASTLLCRFRRRQA